MTHDSKGMVVNIWNSLPYDIVDFAIRPAFKRTIGMTDFYARQVYRQILLRARISYGNSVCLSVGLSVTNRYGFKAR